VSGESRPGNRGRGTSVPSDSDTKREEGASADGLSRSATLLSILVVGDTTRREFRDAGACLGKWGSVAAFSDPDSAAAALVENHVSPDLLVVAQAFPGQFSHETIDRLRRLAPLARVLGLMGSWCEGEMRSGSPWPATVRTYWHHWPARGNRQLRRLATGQSCSWALPLTATDEERLLGDVAQPSWSPMCATAWNKQCGRQTSERTLLVPSSGTLVIRSLSREMADWLSAACRNRGLVTIWQRNSAFTDVEGAAAAIFDCTDLCDDQCDAMRRFAEALRPAPLIALLSFPRIEDHDRAVAAGASAVLSKPLLLEDLLEAVAQSIAVQEASQQ